VMILVAINALSLAQQGAHSLCAQGLVSAPHDRSLVRQTLTMTGGRGRPRPARAGVPPRLWSGRMQCTGWSGTGSRVEITMPASASRPSRAATRAASIATSVALLLPCACGGSPPAVDGPGPVAVGRADREVGPTPLRVCFDATASHAAAGRPLALMWDFGDGSARSAEPVSCHAYAEPGSYAASVEVTDVAGRSALAVVIVTVTEP
jgi:hypothetical protein